MKADAILLRFTREVLKEANKILRDKLGESASIYEVGIKYVCSKVDKNSSRYSFEALLERKLTGSIVARIVSFTGEERNYVSFLSWGWNFFVFLIAETKPHPTPLGSWHLTYEGDTPNKKPAEMAEYFARKLFDINDYVSKFASKLARLAIEMGKGEDGVAEQPFSDWINRFADEVVNRFPVYFKTLGGELPGKVKLTIEWGVDKGLGVINSSLVNVPSSSVATHIIFRFRFNWGDNREVIVYVPLAVEFEEPASDVGSEKGSLFFYKVYLNQIYINLPPLMWDTPLDSLTLQNWSHLLETFGAYVDETRHLPARFWDFEEGAFGNLIFGLARILVPLKTLWIEKKEESVTPQDATEAFVKHMKRACLKLSVACSILAKVWVARRCGAPAGRVFARTSPGGWKVEEFGVGSNAYRRYETSYSVHLLVDVGGKLWGKDVVGRLFTSIGGKHATNGRFGMEDFSRMWFLIQFFSGRVREGEEPPKTIRAEFTFQSDVTSASGSLPVFRSLSEDFDESDESQKKVLLSLWRVLNETADVVLGGEG